MSQARVTDFFSSRKRNRFAQDEVLLNKQKKTHTLIDSGDLKSNLEGKESLVEEQELNVKMTRLKQKLQAQLKQIEEAKHNNVKETPPVNNLEKENDEDNSCKRVTRNSARRKQQVDELKKKMNKFDQDVKKVKESKNNDSKEKETDDSNNSAETTKNVQIELKPIVEAPQQNAKLLEKVDEKEEVSSRKAANKALKMAELRQRINQFNQNLMANQELRAQEVEKKVEEKKETETSVKEDTSQFPAYLKFKDLASKDLDLTCTLTLPKSYAKLLDFFKGSDTIVKFSFNRQEICTFLKLKMGIQNITKQTFTLNHLGQIKHVYTNAYDYKQEKMFIDFKNDYHLTVYPNLEELDTNKDTGSKEFNPSTLLKRLNKFKDNLFKIVKEFHQKFLESLGITNIDIKDIKRWHPKFDLESVKEIEEEELPKAPNESIKCKTGQDLLSIAKDVYSNRLKDAIKNVAELSANTNKSTEPVVKSDTTVIAVSTTKTTSNQQTSELKINSTTTNSTPTSTTCIKENIECKKIIDLDKEVVLKLQEKKAQSYNSLLEKIRNKEKNKAIETMILNSDKEKKLAKYGHYKETIRFLMFYFQSEKKCTLEYDKVCSKMAENFKSQMSDMECRDVLKSICEDESLITKDDLKWVSIIKVRNINYLKLNKSFELNDLWLKCDTAIENLKKSD